MVIIIIIIIENEWIMNELKWIISYISHHYYYHYYYYYYIRLKKVLLVDARTVVAKLS